MTSWRQAEGHIRNTTTKHRLRNCLHSQETQGVRLNWVHLGTSSTKYIPWNQVDSVNPPNVQRSVINNYMHVDDWVDATVDGRQRHKQKSSSIPVANHVSNASTDRIPSRREVSTINQIEYFLPSRQSSRSPKVRTSLVSVRQPKHKARVVDRFGKAQKHVTIRGNRCGWSAAADSDGILCNSLAPTPEQKFKERCKFPVVPRRRKK